MGKPGKLKSGLRSKLKSWRKGGSSSSNPDSNSHRVKAKSRFFHMQPTANSNKGLTLEALKIHDEMGGNAASIERQMSDDASSEGGTFRTFLSGLSDCTNVTFGKIQRYWLNNSAKHKEVCAVLAAITEVIRDQGGEESDTAYFAALVTALSSVTQTESATAVAYLLAMTCKNVPVPVLRAKFGEVSKILFTILSENSRKSDGSMPTALLKSVISCLATVLRQQDSTVWDDASTMNIYNSVLNFSTHLKPKIRKASHNAICSILCASAFLKEDKAVVHPAATATAKFAVTHLDKFGGMSSTSSVCHVLAMLGRVLHTFPLIAIKKSCETVLRLMTLSEPVVKSVCLQTLYNMFLNQPKPEFLTPDLNAQITTALYDYYPNSSDGQVCSAWLAVMEKALVHLSSNFKGTKHEENARILSAAHIPKLTETCLKMLASQNRVVAEASASTVELLLKECCQVNSESNDKEAVLAKGLVNAMFKLLSDGLKYKYLSVWDLVFKLYSTAFKTLITPPYFSVVKQQLSSLVDLRNSPQFEYKSELENCVGSAIAVLGPKLFLQAVPLCIDGSKKDYDFPRSWLLPLLKKSIATTELSFFLEYFLPLAATLRAKSIKLKSRREDVLATSYETLQQQCWDLLPAFCKGASDISSSFPGLARILGRALEEHKDLRLTVLQGLRNVITAGKKFDDDRKTVSRFAKNYLPILFNTYTTIEIAPGQENESRENQLNDANKRKSLERLSALETVKLYLSVADQSLIAGFFARAKSRVFDGADENDATRLALLDLMVAMVIYVPGDQLEEVYATIKPMTTSANASMQKKAYRILEEICGSETDACRQFVASRLEELKESLVGGLSASAPSSKGPRIKCMEQVMTQLGSNPRTVPECVDFIKCAIPEVILCTQGAARSRSAAFDMLVVGAKVLMDSEENNDLKQSMLEEYFQVVFAGLAGSPMTVQATIYGLSRLVYEYKAVMPSSLIEQIISNVCLLLASNTREICKGALGFIMVLFTVLDRATLAQFTKGILDSLLSWKPETRRHFRFKVRQILERLVQKFGYETVYSMTPEAHRKQLHNIQKIQERSKKLKCEKRAERFADKEAAFTKKKTKDSIEDILADSSDSEDEVKEEKRVKKKVKKSAWLHDEGNDPMDLLDAGIARKVVGVDPTNEEKKTKKSDFKTAKDGRLIIGEEEEDQKEEEEDDQVLSSIGVASKRGRKRKMEEEESGYKPGGRGIHRDLEATGAKFKSKKSGGDMKKKDSMEPYAYLPFNHAALNKRKQKRVTGQFKGLVKAAKKGAESGKKMKSKTMKQKRK